MAPTPEKCYCPKIFFAIFLENVAFFEKNCKMKKYSKPHFP